MSRINVRDNRSFLVVVAGTRVFNQIPPPPPQLKFVPIRLYNDSLLCGWIKCNYTMIGVLHNFDHLEKAPYSLKSSDGSDCEIKYLGGLRIAIKFMDLSSRDAFMKGSTKWFSRIDSSDIADFIF